jgi:hypothetical protein
MRFTYETVAAAAAAASAGLYMNMNMLVLVMMCLVHFSPDTYRPSACMSHTAIIHSGCLKTFVPAAKKSREYYKKVVICLSENSIRSVRKLVFFSL